MFDELASQLTGLSRGTWGALGVFEMACAVLLAVPAPGKWMAILPPLAGAALGAR